MFFQLNEILFKAKMCSETFFWLLKSVLKLSLTKFYIIEMKHWEETAMFSSWVKQEQKKQDESSRSELVEQYKDWMKMWILLDSWAWKLDFWCGIQKWLF